jgi:hypothetical protein
VEPWHRTFQDRWDEFERLFDGDWTGNQPGPRLVEAVEALVDEWWNVAADILGEEMIRRPRLKAVIAACDFDQRVPRAIRDDFYRVATDPPS